MTAETEQVWTGSADLATVLRPVGELRNHPDNPWVGDVAQIAESLKRFGQVRPVLVDAQDGVTVVAGNHTLKSAISLGWTHIAAIPNEFKDAAEAKAYMLADNRLAEIGDYDRAALRLELEQLEERAAWDGTGYRPDDLDDLRALEAVRDRPPVLPPDPPSPLAAPPSGGLREVVLMFTPDQRDLFGVALRTLYKEYGTEGVTETTLAALREEADLVVAAEAPDGD